jgi:hypothetical protein
MQTKQQYLLQNRRNARFLANQIIDTKADNKQRYIKTLKNGGFEKSRFAADLLYREKTSHFFDFEAEKTLFRAEQFWKAISSRCGIVVRVIRRCFFE